MTPGGTYKLWGRGTEILTLGQTDNPGNVSNNGRKTENVQPPKNFTCIVTLKRRLELNDSSIFSSRKRTKFSENLNFLRQTTEPGSGDLGGQLSKLPPSLEENNGHGGRRLDFRKVYED